ncbi:hypothetical protein SCNU_19752 [Gordonia neofelifaecis NRRL B-59395]|uniref:Uncharacterized protein n=1 Tax=Gordonia neofelifaecis NRRL B-59395 TaxID=644548 RepID=F1YPV7_9ACTN|nr:hypothetical protein SCNU_19752 [Gordonia neofelifaecis NRRL B-59395]
MYRRGGMPATGAHDTTSTDCLTTHCQAAAATAETTVMQFGTTREAAVYHQTHLDTFLIENIVVALAPTTTSEARSQYQHLTSVAVE